MEAFGLEPGLLKGGVLGESQGQPRPLVGCKPDALTPVPVRRGAGTTHCHGSQYCRYQGYVHALVRVFRSRHYCYHDCRVPVQTTFGAASSTEVAQSASVAVQVAEEPVLGDIFTAYGVAHGESVGQLVGVDQRVHLALVSMGDSGVASTTGLYKGPLQVLVLIAGDKGTPSTHVSSSHEDSWTQHCRPKRAEGHEFGQTPAGET